MFIAYEFTCVSRMCVCVCVSFDLLLLWAPSMSHWHLKMHSTKKLVWSFCLSVGFSLSIYLSVCPVSTGPVVIGVCGYISRLLCLDLNLFHMHLSLVIKIFSRKRWPTSDCEWMKKKLLNTHTHILYTRKTMTITRRIRFSPRRFAASLPSYRPRDDCCFVLLFYYSVV